MALNGEPTYALLRGSRSSISAILPDVVVEEVHRDALAITQHPVEQGASITDHAYRLPAVVEVRYGWSDSSAGYVGHIDEVYGRLRSLQASREPFNVSTIRRRYKNMLLAGVSVVTDSRTSNSLMVVATLQEIIIASTKTEGTGTATTKPADDKAAQSSPAATGGTVDRGEVQPITVTDQSFAGSFNPGNFNVDGGSGVANGSFGLGGLGSGGDYLGGAGGQDGAINLDPIDVPAAPRDISGALIGGTVPGSGFSVFGGV
ncbi:phage baseplate protein [Methylobacterium ajmalii]|jgi:hypothetical protein|uniref:phage baseplate protein n=1 Tax=Methylobacterium ajmalii TaxID=2738439 RepID=UPI00190A8DBE|nr:hypothetical protein [Methylobacterium ajmalii]MBK3400835.1 hypothetical protein [Methylobacterium ajmalii]MBK3412277.1 hypothetical protein [Methylobacterium ajmalii]MBK3426882.1 hypothetical protein [Methylobacterium ajmalii]MBZ6416933.1 hypothetical protein [Methylobacterium sp.]